MDSSSLQLENFSFSYRWLISIKDDSIATTASFIDIDPRLLSLRWTTGGDGRGNPSTSTTKSRDEDSVFFLPQEFIVDDNGNPALESPDLTMSRSDSMDSTRVLMSLSKRYEFPSPISLTSTPSKVRRTSENVGVKISVVLKKFLCFLVPNFNKEKVLNTTSTGRKKRGGQKTSIDRNRWNQSTVTAVDEGLESSIHDAVLHCKKSMLP